LPPYKAARGHRIVFSDDGIDAARSVPAVLGFLPEREDRRYVRPR
jgi:hypothetical protein